MVFLREPSEVAQASLEAQGQRAVNEAELPGQPTLVAVANRLQDLDGRLSAMVNALMNVEVSLHGPSTDQIPTDDHSLPPPNGVLGDIARSTDNLNMRLNILNQCVENLSRTLGP